MLNTIDEKKLQFLKSLFIKICGYHNTRIFHFLTMIDYPKFDTFFIKNGHFYNKIDVISRAERFAEVRFTLEKLIQNKE